MMIKPLYSDSQIGSKIKVATKVELCGKLVQKVNHVMITSHAEV